MKIIRKILSVFLLLFLLLLIGYVVYLLKMI